ncbi:SbcC/MukB-like Walker B domain-containing protein [Bradyrhizobium prioriisuperbiae]|uniref:SbcC/MukB-like Walker B domain-containing protein n=1 Tax=Bradyrhizobium prioriisuperbiae TaxID=2854389 RepID=UPI0028EEFA9D|nr:SbcC/MukB-like Walker B domain-containing protein [Bradyrhizobium prioritasuperba]
MSEPQFGTPQIVRLSLIDFYLIEREDIELSGNTVFLGPNRSGKSSCIDAIQTGLTGGAGDLVVYNAAAVRQNRPDAHRSLQEYCLGVVRHDENERAKVVRKSSQTWIGLSFRTREGGEVAGVVHVVAHEHRERPNTRFMIVTGGGVTTADLVFSTDEGEMAKGFDQAVDGLRASGRKVEECDSASDYSTYLLNLLTYGSWHADAHSYYKAVKRALVFQPVGDITAFMRTHVLETEIIDIGRMRERLAFYREIVRTIDSINRQITSLGIVVGHYSKAAEDDREARGRVAAAMEAAVTQRQSEIDAIEEKLVGLRTKVDVAVEEEKKADERKKEAARRVEEARNSGGTQALETSIRHAERDLSGEESKMRDVRRELKRRAEAIDAIRTAVGYMKDAESRNVRRVADAGADFRRAQDDVEIESMASDAELLQRVVDEVGANAVRELNRAHSAAAAREDRINRIREDLARRARSEAIDQALLRPEAENLRKDLADAKIAATPLCDLIDIREGKEEWRNAVESVLGNAREAMILHDPLQYIDAVKVQRRSTRSDGVEIVKPSVLSAGAPAPAADSLAAVVEVENATAGAYVNAMLGRVKRVRTEADIEREPNAVTTDLMRATRFSSYKMRPPRYLLVGRRGRAQAAQNAVAELQRLHGELKEAETERRVLETAKDAYRTLTGQSSSSQTTLGSVVDGLRRAKTAVEDSRGRLQNLRGQRDPEKEQQIRELEAEQTKVDKQWSAALQAATDARDAVTRTEVELEVAGQQFAAALLDRDAKALGEHDAAQDVRRRVFGILTEAKDFWREHKQTLETAETRAEESRAGVARGHEAWGQHGADFPEVPMPVLSVEAWRERLGEARAMRDLLQNSTLLDKTAEAEEAGRQLSDAFRNEFVSLLVHAFSKIRDTRDDLNREMERHVFYGEKYVFRMNHVEKFGAIVDLVERATEDPNWAMPALVALDADTEQARAVRSIADMIESDDQNALNDLRDPKAYWTFDVLVKDAGTGDVVSTLRQRMKKGSIGEGVVPQYIAMAAAVSAKSSSPDRRNGSLGIILLDDALDGLDTEHTVKMLKFMSDTNLQIVAAAPDTKSRVLAHGMETFINVARDEEYIHIVPEKVSEALRDDLADEDPRVKGYDAYRERTASADEAAALEAAQ